MRKIFLAALLLWLGLGSAVAQTSGWLFPSTATVTVGAGDAGKILSSENAPGAAITVALPNPATVGAGWLMGFSTAGGRGIIVNAPGSVYINAGQKQMTSFQASSNVNYEYFALESDGTNFRLLTSTSYTSDYNGLAPVAGGKTWIYLGSTNYGASLNDNGHTLASSLAGGNGVLTLPSTGNVFNGWGISLYATSGNSIKVQLNGISGGVLYGPTGVATNSFTIPGTPSNFAFITFDGASFRIASTLNTTFLDVKQFGAVGDGVTDDTTAVQNAVNAAGTGFSGGLRGVTFSAGEYCIKTGPITNSVDNIRLIGASQAVMLRPCGADKTVLSLSGFHNRVEHIRIEGSQVLGTTKPAIQLNLGCSECTLDDVLVTGGSSALASLDAGEIWIIGASKMTDSYGPALIYLRNTGGYIWRAKLDQSWPVQNPPAGGALPTAWQATTHYSVGDIVSTNGYVIQASVAGTSGSSAPGLLPYNTNIVDGGVTWLLVGANTYYGIQCDTGCGASLIVALSDLTSSFTNGFAMTNTLAGNAPSGIVLIGNTISQTRGAAVSMAAGGGIFINGGQHGCLLAGCSVFETIADWTGSLTLSGLQIAGGTNGVALGAAGRANITGSIFSNVSTGIVAGSGIGGFSAVGNDFSQNVTAGLVVLSGSSDSYQFTGNVMGNATISDSGTGIKKLIQNVSGNGFSSGLIQDGLATFNSTVTANGATTLNGKFALGGPSPTLSSCGSGPSPSFVDPGNDRRGVVQVGGGTVTSCVVTYSTPLSSNAKVLITVIGGPTIPALIVSARTATGFSVSAVGGGDFHGTQFSYLTVE